MRVLSSKQHLDKGQRWHWSQHSYWWHNDTGQHDMMPCLTCCWCSTIIACACSMFHSFRFCDIVEVYSYACACLPSWTPHKVWVPSGVSVSRANVIIMRAAATKAKFKFILVTTEHLYSGSCSDSECYKQTMRVYCTKIQDPTYALKVFLQEMQICV